MLTKRIIPCLDVTLNKNGSAVVKGIEFTNLREVGDPVGLAKEYNDQQADELVFLDITASNEGRKTMIDVIEKTSEEVFIPLTIGGGVRSIDDMNAILKAGADKISINTAAVKDQYLIKQGSDIFGSQCIVVAIDCKRRFFSDQDVNLLDKNRIDVDGRECWYEVMIKGGRERTGIDAISWAKKAEKFGAGEILLTSMDTDGTKNGYDIPITKAIAESVDIPVIASGGAGTLEHFYHGFKDGKADACLAASIFHFGEYTVADIKRYLFDRGIPVRL